MVCVEEWGWAIDGNMETWKTTSKLVPQKHPFSSWGFRMPIWKINTVKPLHNSHLGDRRKWPLWAGKGLIWQLFIFLNTLQHLYCASSCLLYPILNSNPLINNIYYTQKGLIMFKNVNMTKLASFTTFAIGIVGNLYLLQQYKWNKVKIWLLRLIIDV